MGEIISHKYVTIKEHIEGAPKEEDFEIVTTCLDNQASNSNSVIVKCLQVSIDPYLLNRMRKLNNASHNSMDIASSLIPGQMIDVYGIGRVITSGHPEFQKDDIVVGFLSWAEYIIVENGQMLRKLDPMGFPLSYHLGVLGVSGLTAYMGFFQVCKPKKGEKVFVSAASGSVGSLVGQYAKLFGCYVVGSTGTSQKVAVLKEKLGFDDAFNYKEETDLNLALKRYFPEGIDIYFDNVGGDMLEAAVANMKHFGRVAACGAISQYNDPSRRCNVVLDMVDIIYRRIKIKGFLALDFPDEIYKEFLSTTSHHLHAGEIQVLEDISYGLESIPCAFVGLFHGHNIGKTIVQVSND